MLRKFFIPLMMALVVVAAAVYWFRAPSSHRRDLRETVPVEHFTLSNGLTVVVMPNSRIPAVTHLLVVKAGGADDPQGKTGLAHYLEHLMFTGTKDTPEGEYSRAIARVGGESNAFTGRDYTLYYATVAREHLPMVMAMEADRFQNLTLDAARVAREIQVITEERNQRVDNKAAAQLLEQLDAITFLNHPYRQPIIGWAEDIATLTPDDARKFFASYYRASNMMLIVAGDVTAREVRRYAQQYYSTLPAGVAVARTWPKEPPLRLTRHAVMEDAKARQPLVIRQYVAPSVNEGARENATPLAVFTQYLGGGSSSLLYDQLVRGQKLASAVSADYDPTVMGPGLLRVHAIPAPGVTPTQLEEAMDRVLAAAVAVPMEETALTRAKTLLTAELVFAQDGLEPLAQLIASLYAIGLDEQYFYDWPEAIQRVTAAQAQAAAAAVMVPNRRVTGHLVPIATEVPHAP